MSNETEPNVPLSNEETLMDESIINSTTVDPPGIEVVARRAQQGDNVEIVVRSLGRRNYIDVDATDDGRGDDIWSSETSDQQPEADSNDEQEDDNRNGQLLTSLFPIGYLAGRHSEEDTGDEASIPFDSIGVPVFADDAKTFVFDQDEPVSYPSYSLSDVQDGVEEPGQAAWPPPEVPIEDYPTTRMSATETEQEELTPPPVIKKPEMESSDLRGLAIIAAFLLVAGGVTYRLWDSTHSDSAPDQTTLPVVVTTNLTSEVVVPIVGECHTKNLMSDPNQTALLQTYLKTHTIKYGNITYGATAGQPYYTGEITGVYAGTEMAVSFFQADAAEDHFYPINGIDGLAGDDTCIALGQYPDGEVFYS